MDTTYAVDLAHLTVLADGLDLNAEGKPCATVADLRDFIRELAREGAFDAATRDELLAEVAE